MDAPVEQPEDSAVRPDEEPGLSELERYLAEHGIIPKSFPIKGEDGREVTFLGEREKLKDLVKDVPGEAIDDSWEWGMTLPSATRKAKRARESDPLQGSLFG